MKRATRTRNQRPTPWGLGVLVCLLPLLATGKSSDRSAPIQTSSTSTSSNAGPNTKSVLTGNVRIVQGTLVATGDLAEIYTGADSQVSRVVLTGGKAHIEQLDDQGHRMEADARRVDYDLVTSRAVLTGQASAKKESMGVTTAPKIIYNVADGTFNAEGSDGDPVHMTLYPRQPKPSP
jgi:lipopolysaccharide export system protein LptA